MQKPDRQGGLSSALTLKKALPNGQASASTF